MKKHSFVPIGPHEKGIFRGESLVDGEGNEATMVSILRERFQERPEHRIFTWLDSKGREVSTMTYRQLWLQSGAIATMLHQHPGIQPGDRVMICYPFGLEFLPALFGCMRAGVVACSAYPPNPTKFQTDMPIFLRKAKDAGAKHCLTTSNLRRLIAAKQFLQHGLARSDAGESHKLKWISTNHLSVHPNPNHCDQILADCPKPQPEGIAFIQYTSGSTGFPKGVMISHRCLLGNCAENAPTAGKCSSLEETMDSPVVSWVPQYHDLGLIACFMTSVYAAWRAHCFSPLDFIQHPLLWHQAVVKYKAVMTQGPNFSFGLVMKRLVAKRDAILQAGGRRDDPQHAVWFERWSSLRCANVAAEPVDPKVLERIQTVLGVPRQSLLIGYGMAETGVFISDGDGRVHQGVVGCGNVEGRTVSLRAVLNHKTVPDGTEGEIWVRSTLVAAGYWNQPQLTKETFDNVLEGHDGKWLATGDLGKIVDGHVYICGRKKDVIIINGRNYYAIDLERTIEETYPTVIRPGCNVAFQCTPTSVGIAAEVRKGTPRANVPDPSEIRRIVSRAHGVPISYLVLLQNHTVPKTTSGKLRRVLTKEWCLQNQWKPTNVIDLWKQPQEHEEALTKKTTPLEEVVTRTSHHHRARGDSPHPDSDLGSSTEADSLDTSQDGVFSPERKQSLTKPETTNSERGVYDQLSPPRKGPRPTSLSTAPSEQEGLLDQTINDMRQSFRQASGRDIGVDEPFADLGMSSMEVAQLHATLETTLDADPDTLPIEWLFNGELTIQALAERFLHGDPDAGAGAEPDVALELIVEQLENNLDRMVDTQMSLGNLAMSEKQTRIVRDSICLALGKNQADFPLAWLRAKGSTVQDLANRLSPSPKRSPLDRVRQPRPSRVPQHHPWLVSMVNGLFQTVAILVPPLLFFVASFPMAYVLTYQGYRLGASLWYVNLLLLPIYGIVNTLVVTLMLVITKWVLVGKEKPGSRTLWGSQFARRWIVRQFARLLWTYSHWALLGDTELLCVLHRILGSRIGTGVTLSLGMIEDFDLVSIGDGSSVSGLLNTESVSLGVQTIEPISIGNRCSISSHVQIEQGVTIEDDVTLDEQTMVSKGSTLAAGTHWQGLPAKPKVMKTVEIETGGDCSDAMGNQDSAELQSRRAWHHFCRYVVMLLVSPYLLIGEFVVAFYAGYQIWNVGFWALGIFFWVPPTLSLLLATVLTVVLKWCLLGRVREGSWPLYGSFYRSKWVVDHFVSEHVLRWQEYGILFGSPLANSASFQSMTLRCLGCQVGRIFEPPSSAYKCYDLLEVGHGALLGGGSAYYVFEEEGDRLFGRRISIGNEATIGTRSVIRPGVSMAESSAVAGYSIARPMEKRLPRNDSTSTVMSNLTHDFQTERTSLLGGYQKGSKKERKYDIMCNEICVGSQVHRRKVVPPVGDDLIVNRHTSEEMAAGLASMMSSIGTALVTWGVAHLTRHYSLVPVGGWTPLSVAIASSAAFSLGLSVGLPVFALLMNILSKAILVGKYEVDRMPYGSCWHLVGKMAWTHNMHMAYRSLIVQAFGGSWVEVAMHRMLGATIGLDVYMDSIWLFEPDLVSIGDNVAVNKYCALSPHQFTPAAAEFGPVYIGSRCTIGSNTSLHGRDTVEDNVDVEAFTLPLIGTKLTSGTWVGYPAKRASHEIYQPPRVPNPLWYVGLTHPLDGLFGIFWMLVLNVDKCSGISHCWKARCDDGPNEATASSLPMQLRGSFRLEQPPGLALVEFERGVWIDVLRCLQVDCWTCVVYSKEQRVHMDPWWSWSVYNWTFDADLKKARGRVRLGFWLIPLSILSVTLERDENDKDSWLWSHIWFEGAPQQVTRLQKVHSQ